MPGIDDTWTWRTLTPATPPADGRYAMGFAWGNGRALMFGGVNKDGVPFNPLGTFELVGDEWNELSPSTSPPERGFCKMVYDTIGERFLLYGGVAIGVGVFNDLWEFPDSTGEWNELFPSNSPDPTVSLSDTMVWDGTRIVLFTRTGGGVTQTWEYAASDWTRIGVGSAADFFDTREYAPLCWADDRTIECGGSLTTDETFNDTNEFDGAAWANTIADGVSAWLHRRQHGLIWDGFTAFMFAGTTRTVGSIGEACVNDCYTYDKTSPAWTQRFPLGTTPLERQAFGMIFDGTRVIGYGGHGSSTDPPDPQHADTFVLEPPAAPIPVAINNLFGLGQ